MTYPEKKLLFSSFHDNFQDSPLPVRFNRSLPTHHTNAGQSDRPAWHPAMYTCQARVATQNTFQTTLILKIHRIKKVPKIKGQGNFTAQLNFYCRRTFEEPKKQQRRRGNTKE